MLTPNDIVTIQKYSFRYRQLLEAVKPRAFSRPYTDLSLLLDCLDALLKEIEPCQ